MSDRERESVSHRSCDVSVIVSSQFTSLVKYSQSASNHTPTVMSTLLLVDGMRTVTV